MFSGKEGVTKHGDLYCTSVFYDSKAAESR